jgi:uncharacterized surface protein with fasciclin (FAS1) repeats
MKLSVKIMSSVMALAVCFAFMPIDGQSQQKDENKDKMKDQTIIQVASANSNLSTLVEAVKAAGMEGALNAKGPITVFAPTNEAFAALPEGTLEDLMKPENKDKLKKILSNHIVSGAVMSGDLKDGQMVETMEGSKAEVTMEQGTMINDAKVVKANIEASNGVVHVIDKVLIPSDKGQVTEDRMMEEDEMEETMEDTLGNQ